jgi:hypothetical protein
MNNRTYFAVRQGDVGLFVQSGGRTGYGASGESIEEVAERFVTSGHAYDVEDTGLWEQEEGEPRPCGGDALAQFHRVAQFLAGGS